MSRAMEVVNYNGPVEFMRPVAEAWRAEANADRFGLNLDTDKFMRTLQGMADSDKAALLILSNEGRAVGFMGVVMFESPLNGQQIANEHFWFVLPRHRGRNALKLVKAVREWAKENGASHLMLNASMLASDKHDALCRLYSRKMKHFETTFIQEL